jgi:AAA ATPase-like protein
VSFESQQRRVESCPGCVSILTDGQLLQYARDAAGDFSNDITLHAAVIGELMLRKWLYLEFNADELIPTALAESLVLAKSLRSTRTPDFSAIENRSLGQPHRTIWDVFEKRVRAFLECDGIIPVVFDCESIAIPFKIHGSLTAGTIEDSSDPPKAVRAWMQKADQLWKALGQTPGIRLNCVIDDSPESEPDGASFAVPVLLGLSHQVSNVFRPLDVIATGAVVADKIENVDGKKRKEALSKRLGALFFAPCIDDDEANGRYRLPLGVSIAECLQIVWKRLRDSGKITCPEIVSLNAITKTCGAVAGSMTVTRRVDFSKFIAERTETFVGREQHLTEVKKWIEANRQPGGLAWITGQPGVGKTAFMCQLAVDLAQDKSVVCIEHFFGAEEGRPVATFFDESIAVLQDTFSLDVRDSLEEADLAKRLARVIEKALGDGDEEFNRNRSLVFVLDGLNELAQSPADLTKVVDFVLRCQLPRLLCVCAGLTEGSVTQLARAPHIHKFWPEGKLPVLSKQAVAKWLISEFHGNEVAAGALEQLAAHSGGLALWLRHVINDIKRGELTFAEAEKIPAQIESYYEKLLERLAAGDRSRPLLRKILFLLTWAEEPITQRLFNVFLQSEPYGKLRDWESLLNKAFDFGKSLFVLELGLASSTGTPGWRLYHDGLRRFLRRMDDPDCELAQLRWLELCEQWQTTSESDIRKYALLFYPNHLAHTDPSKLYELAESDEFFAAQREILSGAIEAQRCPTRLALAKAIEADDALAMIKFTLLHAQRVEAQRIEARGGESPLEALRRNKVDLANERIALFPSAGDRILWRLVLATEHLASEDPRSARLIVEDVFATDGKLDLDPTQAKAAALLLAVIATAGIKIWRRIGFYLRNAEAQLLLCEKLAEPGFIDEAIEVRNTISEACRDEANKAQREIVKATARTRPVQFVERGREQLGGDESQYYSQYYWAAVDAIEALLARREFGEAYRLFQTIPESYFWQRVRGRCAFAIVNANNGKLDFASTEIQEAEKLLPTPDGQRRLGRHAEVRIDPKYRHMIPNARGYLALATIRCNFGTAGVREAIATFRQALKDVHMLKGSQKFRACGRVAQNYVEAALLNPLCRSGAQNAISRFSNYIEEAGANPDAKQESWSNVAKLWAKLGHKAEMEQALANSRKFRHDAVRAIAGWFFKNGQSSVAKSFLFRVPGPERLLIGVGIGKQVVSGETSLDIRDLIASCLMQRVGSPTTARWGIPRVLSEIGVTLVRNGERDLGLKFFESTAGRLRDFKAGSKETGFGLSNLGCAAAFAGEETLAKSFLSEAFEIGTRIRAIKLLGEIAVGQARSNFTDDARQTFAHADFIVQMEPNHSKRAMRLAELCQFRAEAGFVEDAVAMRDPLNELIGIVRQIDQPKLQSDAIAQVASELGQAALHDQRFLELAQALAEESKQIWQAAKSSPKLSFGLSSRTLRVETLVKAFSGAIEEAVSETLRIRASQRTRALRDLAVFCINKSQPDKAVEIASLIEADGDRIADIADEFGRHEDRANVKNLLPLAAQYPSAAFRMAALLIHLYQPDHKSMNTILDLLDEPHPAG